MRWSRLRRLRSRRQTEQRFFEAGWVFDIGGGEGAVDLAVEAGEDFAGADFDVMGDAGLMQKPDALNPADGAGDLADEGVADGVGGGEEAGVDVGGDGEGGVVEGDGGEVGGELELRGHHERAVEGSADGEHDGALGSEFLAAFGSALDGGF